MSKRDQMNQLHPVAGVKPQTQTNADTAIVGPIVAARRIGHLRRPSGRAGAKSSLILIRRSQSSRP